MTNKKLLFFVLAIGLFSFKLTDSKTFEFAYPKRNGTTITVQSDHIKKFTKDWRGSDYYYFSESEGFVFSVLYYKLNKNETAELIDVPKSLINGPDKSPAYPFAYFSNYSNLKSMEKNDSAWGTPTDDFMFRQNDVGIEGTAFTQKHMYGYAMVDKDLFVNVHLSKTACSPTDSTEMINVLKSLTLKK